MTVEGRTHHGRRGQPRTPPACCRRTEAAEWRPGGSELGFQLHGLWRSLVSALDWGSRGRRFKSCQPDGVSRTHVPKLHPIRVSAEQRGEQPLTGDPLSVTRLARHLGQGAPRLATPAFGAKQDARPHPHHPHPKAHGLKGAAGAVGPYRACAARGDDGGRGRAHRAHGGEEVGPPPARRVGVPRGPLHQRPRVGGDEGLGVARPPDSHRPQWSRRAAVASATIARLACVGPHKPRRAAYGRGRYRARGPEGPRSARSRQRRWTSCC